MKSSLFSLNKLPAWIISIAASLFVMPWHFAKIITGGTWANTEQFATAIQNGFLVDLKNKVPSPGYGDSALAIETKFWFWFHLSKACFAFILLVLFYFYIKENNKISHFSVSKVQKSLQLARKIASNILAVFIFLILSANIQGVIAPLSSLISFLPANDSDLYLSQSIRALRNNLLSSEPNSFTASILRDFSIYHLSIACIFGLTTIFLFKTLLNSIKKMDFSSAFAVGILGIGFLLLGVANIGTAIHPIPAFNGFLGSL